MKQMKAAATRTGWLLVWSTLLTAAGMAAFAVFTRHIVGEHDWNELGQSIFPLTAEKSRTLLSIGLILFVPALGASGSGRLWNPFRYHRFVFMVTVSMILNGAISLAMGGSPALWCLVGVGTTFLWLIGLSITDYWKQKRRRRESLAGGTV